MSGRRTRTGSRYESLPQDDPGNYPQSSSRSQSFPSYQRSRPLQSSVRSRTSSSGFAFRTYEPPTALDFHWDHFGPDSQTFDDSGVEGVADIFGEEVVPFETPTNIAEDVIILQSIELIIDYPDGRLGEGLFGAVYRGYYGSTIQNFQDVEPSRRFAVKIMDFGDTDTYTNRLKREKFETEKYVLTEAINRGIVTIKTIINMGEQRIYPFEENPYVTFTSADRQYLVMDFADEGELESFLFKYRETIEPSLRINFIRDLFFGLFYLHQYSILHGDVHPGNVLIFTEEGEKVAKWSDFGLSYVGTTKPYRFKKPQSLEVSESFHASFMRSEAKFDIQGMFEIFDKILENRHLCRAETPEETFALNECLRMIEENKNADSLRPIYHNFTHILVDELILDEQYYG